MKGDFSRIRFDPRKHYTAVVEQQGRVALDSDGNEGTFISDYIRGVELDDIIGPYGAPQDDAGFAITVNDGAITIGPGRYYVNGLLCENDQTLGYVNQPYLINPSPLDNELLQQLRSGALTRVQLYLEVWERLVTALDDPCLREPALGQADTTARIQTVWRVVGEPVHKAQSPVRLSPAAIEELRSRFSLAEVAARVAAPTDLVEEPGTAASTEPDMVLLRDCCAEMYGNLTPSPSTGKLSAQTSGEADDCSCEPTPAAGYRGLENQLYRVEIHQAGDELTATFKWSRENGSVLAAVTGVSGSNVQVDSLGPDAYLGFCSPQWVELSDDTYLFGQPANQPGDLIQIQSILRDQMVITMAQPAPGVDPSRNARMRRWDQNGTSAESAGVPLSAGSWLDLENGIQIQFSPGQYQTGDYWLIPARTASGQIEWPPCDSDGNPFQSPRSTQIRRAPLACLQWEARAKRVQVEDCRRLFPPLTDLAPTPRTKALHVTKINWINDDVMTLDQLVARGLSIGLDGPVASPVDGGAFIVSLENVVLSEAAGIGTFAELVEARFTDAQRVFGRVTLRSDLIVEGQISVNQSGIIWQIPSERGDRGAVLLVADLQRLLLNGLKFGQFGRVRVKLLGHTVFGNNGQQLFLDGQSFGQPGVRADGSTQRVDLHLPSGNQERATDFESWFYLAPTQQIASLTLDHTSVRINDAGAVFDASLKQSPPLGKIPFALQATIDLPYPAVANTQPINLSVIPPAGISADLVTVQGSVTIPRGQTSSTAPVTLRGNPGREAQTFTLVASLPLADGSTTSQQVTLSFAGF